MVPFELKLGYYFQNVLLYRQRCFSTQYILKGRPKKSCEQSYLEEIKGALHQWRNPLKIAIHRVAVGACVLRRPRTIVELMEVKWRGLEPAIYVVVVETRTKTECIVGS
jgi:hypothetical protein